MPSKTRLSLFKPRPVSLRSKLIGLVLVTMIPLLVFTVAMIIRRGNEERSLLYVASFGIALMALGLALAWLLSSKAAKFIESLAVMVDDLGLGKEPAGANIVPSSVTEVQNLREALLTAARLIQERTESLCQVSERLELAHEAANVGTFERDFVTNEIKWSRSQQKLYGLSPGDFGGKYDDWKNRVHPDDILGVEAAVRYCVETAKPLDLEYRIIRPDGTLRWMACQARIFFDDSGMPRRMVGINIDITERKRVEEAVARAGERFERIAATTPDFLFVYDLIDRRIVYANPRVEEQLGYTVAEVEGLEIDPMDLFVHPDDLAGVRECYTRFETAAEGKVLEWQFRGIHADRTYRWLHVRATVFERTADGKVQSIIGYSRDITNQKQLESDREELLAIAEQSGAEAEKANRAKDEFLAMLGHELRNPLGVISTSVQLLRRKGPDEPVLQELRDTIARQVEHIARLIDDLLDVSRIARKRILLDKRPCDLTAIVSNTLEDYRVQLEESELHLVLDLPDRPVWATVDRTRLAQIVGNLLHNAIKFTENGGYVTVSLTENTDAKVAVLTVRDTGIGIEPHMVARLFEPFVQAEHSIERSRGGLGLGLALVKGLVELQGGTVQGSSEGREQGSEFTIRLPLDRPSASSLEIVAAPDRDDISPRRILIIEDSFAGARNIEKFFTQSGHTVEVVHTGPEGIQAARGFKPEVVLCDIGLPGLDGYAVARALRQEPDLKQAYLIAVTGYGRPEDQQRALEAGFDTHLTKPIDLNELKSLVGKLTARNIVDPADEEAKPVN